MKLIVGLGNPGKEYENTRHNVGFMVLDKYLKENNITVCKEKFGGLYYESFIKEEKVIFLKPQKYINLSGQVLKYYIDFFKLEISDLLIIHDDLDTPCGSIKLRSSGGSGGHNGLKDIENNIHTKDYKRIKIGVSNNKTIDTRDYVLGKFNSEDKKIMNSTIEKAQIIINDYFTMTFDNLMNKYN